MNFHHMTLSCLIDDISGRRTWRFEPDGNRPMMWSQRPGDATLAPDKLCVLPTSRPGITVFI